MKADKTKKGFLLYKNYATAFKALNDEQAGQLIKAIFEFVNTGEVVDVPPAALPLYMMITERLAEDLERYEEICRQRAEFGKQGGRPPKTEENQN